MKPLSGWSLIRLYTIGVYVFMFAPIVAVIILSFNPQQFGSFPVESFSLRWYVKLAHNRPILYAFKNSLVLGSLTAIVVTAIGIPASLAFVRYDFPGKTALNTLLLMPIMVPEIVLGVALLLFIPWLLFWATAQNQTVPVKIFGMLRNSISPEINALGTVMIVLTVTISCWPASCRGASPAAVVKTTAANNRFNPHNV